MREFALEHLHHQTLAAVLDALLEERLDLVRRVRIRRLRVLELELDGLEVVLEHVAPLGEVEVEQGLWAYVVVSCLA